MKNTRDLLLCLIVVLGLMAMPAAMAAVSGNASGMYDVVYYGDDGDDGDEEDGEKEGGGY